MTLNEWVKNELEYWQETKSDAQNSDAISNYCEGRIDAAKAVEKFVYLNEKDAG